jgi:signal transduction histidine kinase
MFRSVRTRILAWGMALTALGLIGAGVAAYLVEGARVDRRIDEALLQEVQEFEELQDRGVDPRTGRPFSSIDRLLEVALRRNVPDEHQAIIGFLDGRPAYVHTSASHGLEENAAFIDAVTSGPVSFLGTLDTDDGEVRYASKAVLQRGERRGAYAVAYFAAQEHAEFQDVIKTYAVVALLSLVAVGVGAWSVAGRLLRPIRELQATAQQISDTDLTQRIHLLGNDEVADLAHTFNAMLDRLEDAFATQRHFLDDAGHELRTPITIIRGHLELLDERNVEEVEATRALVLDEIDRMSRLVEDLVMLAKAQRPDFLRLQPVDVGVLTDDVFDKSRALGKRIWQLDSRGTGTVLADSQRLTQALLQLATNAIQHTGRQDTVAVGSFVHAAEVRLWVRDTGAGVPSTHATRIFERFQRGPDSRSKDGSGLGLSIVQAIAEAHGGYVELDSEPGEGAVFTVIIPRLPGSTLETPTIRSAAKPSTAHGHVVALGNVGEQGR